MTDLDKTTIVADAQTWVAANPNDSRFSNHAVDSATQAFINGIPGGVAQSVFNLCQVLAAASLVQNARTPGTRITETYRATGIVFNVSSLKFSYTLNINTESFKQGGVIQALSFDGGQATPTFVLINTFVRNATPNQISLAFSSAVDGSSLPSSSDFSVSGGRSVTGVSVSGSVLTLTVDSAYSHGDSITIGYAKGVNPLKGTNGIELENLTARPVSNGVLAPVVQPTVTANAIGIGTNVIGVGTNVIGVK